MLTFIIGMVILLIGGIVYGKICERVFGPDDRKTPAFLYNDGVDFVPMSKWKNCLIELLNIAGTGPVLGPIQGILFGPIAFITIPIGCIIGGAMHDYMIGMISMRNKGGQMPVLVNKYLGKRVSHIFNIFVCLTGLLVGIVFIYTPGDLFVTHILYQSSDKSNIVLWVVYGVIFLYYLVATLFPIDKIIGKIYPIFGGLLLLSAVGIFIGIFANGYKLDEIWNVGLMNIHPSGERFLPVFFVTVACGIVSGFHSTQTTLVTRTIKSEKEGRMTFYNMMLLEGVIAMIWAAAAMGMYNKGVSLITSPTEMVGIIAKDMLGSVGGFIAIIGIIILPITTGDTALRSLRLIIAECLHIDQINKAKRLSLSLVVFAIAGVGLVFAKISEGGFAILWRYFAWANQTIAVFVFATISVYLIRNLKKKYLSIMSIIPGMFYMFIIASYIFNAKIGFNLPWLASYILGGVCAVIYCVAIIYAGCKGKSDIEK